MILYEGNHQQLNCDAHFISNGQIHKNHDENADQYIHFFICLVQNYLKIFK